MTLNSQYLEMKSNKYTVEEYLQLEIDTSIKHEFHDGKVYALAGGSINHGLLCGNIYSEYQQQWLQNVE